MYASTNKSDLYVANISSAPKTTISATPHMTIRGLKYTTSPYYYRVETLDGSSRRFQVTIGSVGLRPAAPTGVHVMNNTTGTDLTWSSGASTGFVITQATNAALTAHRHNYTVHGQSHQFTPYGLTKKTTYYFRVRAETMSTLSSYSAEVRAAVATSEQPVTVMTYNIMEATTAGQHEGGQVIPAWSARRAGAIHLILQSDPDLVAVQEGAAWVGQPEGYGGTRQVDDLTARLKTYSLAATEVTPKHHGYLRTGNYVLYKKATYDAVGIGGHWDIGDSHTAAFQEVENRESRAKILFVSPHLDTGAGSAADTRRENETKSLLRQATAHAARVHASVVYAGDFNSDVNPNHAFDGPGVAMRSAHAADGQVAAQSVSNARYNSANLYMRTPPAVGQSIDHVYAPAGVGVRSWGIVLDLSRGKFVGTIPSDHNPVVATLSVPY